MLTIVELFHRFSAPGTLPFGRWPQRPRLWYRLFLSRRGGIGMSRCRGRLIVADFVLGRYLQWLLLT